MVEVSLGTVNPSKNQGFSMAVAHNWIPSAVNLAGRVVTIDRLCLLCRFGAKTTFHSLWGCPPLKSIRQCISSWLAAGGSLDQEVSILDFLTSARQRLQVQRFELLCVVLWRIWFCRNRAIHGKLLIPAGDVVDWCCEFLSDFQNNSDHENLLSSSFWVVDLARWCPPSAGTLKLNSDASVHVDSNFIGIGFVIRNSAGLVVGAGALPLLANLSPLLAEATAILYGIRFVRDFGLAPVHVESDSLGVINSL
ncbi:hypothetical protein ACOSQ4_016560 [Xanthoceras sorbifolium]